MALYGTEFNITYTAWNTTINSGVTGDSANHSLYWVKDGSSTSTTNSPSEVDASNVPGLYKLTVSSEEAACIFGTLCGKSSTPNISIIPTSIAFEKLPNALPGAYGGLPTTDAYNRIAGISGTLNLLDDLNNFDPSSDTVVNVTNVTSIGESGNLAQTVWEYVSRILTADTNINYPTSGDIASAVWEKPIALHNTTGTFGAKNQKVVPSETLNDYKATGFSTHSAADVWTVTDRYLTSAENISGVISQRVWEYPTRTITADTNINYPSAADNATAIWAAVSRTLSGPDNLNIPTSGQNAQMVWEYNNRILTDDTNISIPGTGDISKSVWEYGTRELTSAGAGGATAQEVWEYGTRYLTADTNINYPSSGDIASAVWNNGVRILTANTNFNDPTAATISSQVASDLLAAHGAGNWTTADTSALATTSQLLSVSGDLSTDISNLNTQLQYNSGVLDTVNQNVSYILIYNNTSGVPLTSAERNSIADAILQRSMSFVEDSATEYTLCTLILAGLNSSVAGTTRTIRKTDASTYITQTVTTDAAAEPITGVS